MTDFYSVLQRAVRSLPDGSGPQRRQVYEKARKALIKQLQSFDPPLSSADVTAQRLALEDAIRKIENEIARQNRTRRAVQGALPTTNGGRTGAEAGARESEAEREARRRAEAERSRAEREEMLRSAVSDAMLSPEGEVESPQPASLPAPVEVPIAPLEPSEPEEVGDDFLEADYEDDVPIVPARQRGHRADPNQDEAIDEAEFEAVDDAEDVAYEDAEAVEVEPSEDDDEADPRDEKRRRREEARQLRAERRASRGKAKAKTKPKKEKKPKAAKARRQRGGEGGSGRRSLVARIALPLVVFCLLIGASYAVVTQHERLLAVIQTFSPEGGETPDSPARAPVASADGPVVNKSQARLSGDEDEPRAVEAQDFTLNPSGNGETAPNADAGAPARTPTGAPQFAPDEAPNSAEQQVAAVTSTTPPQASSGGGSQSAVLYEEAVSGGQTGSAVAGTVEWEMVRQSFGGGEPEPVIRATSLIGERGMKMTITIRENQDSQLPASHLIEIKFDVPESFEGGGVQNVPGIIMKQQEQARGDALRGQAARVSSGLFWVALNEDDADREYNLELLAERDWLDIPILYESGRRAILTLRKGPEGLSAVDSAMREWTSG